MIYIHIGYPKTATTYLQNNVFNAIEGCNFMGFNELCQNGLIDLTFRKESSLDYNHLAKIFDSEKDYIISYEGFVGIFLNGSVISDFIPNRIKKVVEKPRILITIRNQKDMFKSLYIQYVISGGTLKASDFYASKPPQMIFFDWDFLNYTPLINKYKKAFGADNVFIVPYELLKKNHGLFINEINKFIDDKIVLTEKDNSKVVNRSLGKTALSILRMSNNMVSSYVSDNAIVPPKIMTNKGLKYYIHSLFARKPFKYLDPKFELKEELIGDINNYYKASNLLLQKKLPQYDLPGLGYSL
ncbi:MAG: sulfotransferase domain-containing protein [Bacteroidota bacterium]